MKSFFTLLSIAVVINFAKAQYCIPTYTNLCANGNFIDRVEFEGIDNSPVGSGCNGNPDNYIFNAADTAKVKQGLSYTVTLTPPTVFAQGMGVWIDFNADGDISDSGEFVFSSPPDTVPVSGTINIPETATLGNTRLRVRCMFNVTPVAGDLCNNQTSGEVEDYNITIQPLPTQEICIVTVDSTTKKNIIIWEKNFDTSYVATYNIYKENITSGYDLIGNVSNNSLSTFIDSSSNPVQKADRYKITQVNVNGYESNTSIPHKTIHLTVNPGIPPKVNLIWDHYKGFIFGTYRIWRGNGSSMNLIGSVQGNLTSYTDTSPPPGDSLYFIEVLHPTGCNPTAKTYISSTSNTVNKNLFTGINENSMINYLLVYPNPNDGRFYLKFNLEEKNIKIKIINQLGGIIYQADESHVVGLFNEEINLYAYPNGIYFIQIQVGDSFVNKKFVIIKPL